MPNITTATKEQIVAISEALNAVNGAVEAKRLAATAHSKLTAAIGLLGPANPTTAKLIDLLDGLHDLQK